MRIDKVIIDNFRIYYGKIEVNLKQNELNKNISIIAGYNGFGKTTFLNALIWCFYGKLIADVDDKYRKEIYEVGGYKKYSFINLNREARSNSEVKQNYSVEIELSEINIPTVPCKKITIKRSYDVLNESETVNVFIDGFENELTKEVGSDIFINDFILPREIAKFFFFDAEKIVSLSEIKTVGEKRNLSLAYSEVLGISKYENLKKNLESLRIKLRKRSANVEERNKLELIQNEVKELNRLLNYNNDKILEIKAEIEQNRILSEQYQVKLIREGNNISLEELISLKKLKDKLREDNIEIKSKLKDLLELVPFAIAGDKTKELYFQIQKETSNKQKTIDSAFINERLFEVRNKLIDQLKNFKCQKSVKDEIKELINRSFDSNFVVNDKKIEKVLLELSEKEKNEFNALYDNLKHAFDIIFKQIVKEERNNRIFLTKTIKKITLSESKESDILSKKLKTEKERIDKRILVLDSELNKLFEESGAFQQNITTKSKLISELSKTVSLDEIDSRKDKVVERIISELSEFLFRYKFEKKHSLETRLKNGLKLLMHKEKYIVDVEVEMSDELIDIHLFDKKGELIEKEALSKGEQQLYATALLKALVEESEVQFPIFIDSPLQKFDKKHSNNIIKEFYPSISKQVILLPLLEKELSEKEYELLIPHINQVFLICNTGEKSSISEYQPRELFSHFELYSNVHAYKDIKN
jgi:DNA sulfur modification protein DndD